LLAAHPPAALSGQSAGSGIKSYLFEMANIRNQCSWVHSHDNEAATLKAKELVQMAVFRAALLSLKQLPGAGSNSRASRCAGPAGMTAAFSGSRGFSSSSVEKNSEPGGNLPAFLRAPTDTSAGDPEAALSMRSQPNQIFAVYAQPGENHQGFKGNFTTEIEAADGRRFESSTATILATGAQEYRQEYGYVRMRVFSPA